MYVRTYVRTYVCMYVCVYVCMYVCMYESLGPLNKRFTFFWEVMHSFVLLACASLAALRSLLQNLLVCLNFTLNSEDLLCW